MGTRDESRTRTPPKESSEEEESAGASQAKKKPRNFIKNKNTSG